jgi:hypothetical protein
MQQLAWHKVFNVRTVMENNKHKRKESQQMIGSKSTSVIPTKRASAQTVFCCLNLVIHAKNAKLNGASTVSKQPVANYG